MMDEQQQRWRREFEESGYEAVRNTIRGTSGWDERRRKFAFQWLREKEREVEHRTEESQKVSRRSLLVAYFALAVAALSLMISMLPYFRP
jgi:hypothetical protein